jgi:hypothetical protein
MIDPSQVRLVCGRLTQLPKLSAAEVILPDFRGPIPPTYVNQDLKTVENSAVDCRDMNLCTRSGIE